MTTVTNDAVQRPSRGKGDDQSSEHDAIHASNDHLGPCSWSNVRDWIMLNARFLGWRCRLLIPHADKAK